MNSETKIQNSKFKIQNSNEKNLTWLKIIAVTFTLLGAGLFAYFIYSVGLSEILEGIGKIGFGGFLLLQLIYFFRITARAASLICATPFRL
ncbi:MAG: hypothetical protein LC768_02560 [Acidobacteria bacterium]|nr:hypothetical protein [Acidobacteriota bacterium]